MRLGLAPVKGDLEGVGAEGEDLITVVEAVIKTGLKFRKGAWLVTICFNKGYVCLELSYPFQKFRGVVGP
jgi:hypothetical protein